MKIIKHLACPPRYLPLLRALGAVLAGLAATASVGAQTFSVANSGFSAFVINSQLNPTLNLERGVTYVFTLNSPGHPFWIKTIQGNTTANAFNNGVTGNGSTSGTLTFAVPANAPDTLFYNCQFHSAMTGRINVTTPVVPPTVKIVHISVGANVVVQSTGATNWSVTPQYRCDLAGTNWTDVPVFTNTLADGTNTTTFPRLDPICGSSNVFLRIRNQRP